MAELVDASGLKPGAQCGHGGSSPSPGTLSPQYSLFVTEVAHPVTALEWDTPLYRQARTQLEQALPGAGISQDVAERLRVSPNGR